MTAKPKRKHRNNLRRLTAKERASTVTFVDGSQHPEWPDWVRHRDVIERALQAHAKQTLARRGPSSATIKRRFLAQLRRGTWQYTDSMREAIALATRKRGV